MWEILKILFSDALNKIKVDSFINTFFKSTTGKILKKLIKISLKGKNLITNLNPISITNRFIRSFKPKQAQQFQNTINKLIRSANIKKLIQTRAQERAKAFSQQNGFKNDVFNSLDRNEILNKSNIDIFIPSSTLSSSWLVYGIYYPTRKTGAQKVIGNLELTIHPLNSKRPSKNYLYFNVPYTTWKSMTEATGRHGSGAGSVFWGSYLHAYLGPNQNRANKIYNKIKGKKNYRSFTYTTRNIKKLKGY